jgi:hypothetical protein
MAGVLFIHILQIIFISNLSLATPLPADWLDTSADPSLQSGETINSATYDDISKKPHEECIQKTYVTRPARPGQSQQTTNRCWYKTPMGMVSGEYAVGNGKNIAGKITGRAHDGNSGYYFYPTPRSDIILDKRASSSSDTYRFRYNPSLTASVNSNGSLTYTFSSSSTFTIGTETSTTLASYNINYSENGKYAMFSNNTSLARVSLDTKQILTYGAPSGWYPGTQMDSKAYVTEDGTYAVVTAGRVSSSRWMRVFDLNDCRYGEYSYLKPNGTTTNCVHRNFKALIESNIPSFSYYTVGEFVDNDTIAFYHRVGSSSPIYTKYTMSISGGNGGTKYFALGDSLSSGEGAFSYVYPTAETSPKNQCHTSSKSYPYLINDQLSLSGFASFACSGATIPKVVGSDGIRTNPANEPYSDNQWYHEDYETTHYWSPGFDNQLKKVKKEKPNIVTISIGINDIGFEKKLTSCLKGTDTCFESYEDRKELANQMKGTFNTSVNTYKRLKNAAAPNAKIYVLGYPQIVKPGNPVSCGINVQLDSDERQFIHDATLYLNSVIEAAANKAGVYYTNIENSLYGYRHCEGSTGNVAVNGLTKGDDLNVGGWSLWQEVIGKETYHPNKLGHQLLRNAVITETSSFTQTMPAPDSTMTAPAVTDTIPLLENAQKNNRAILNTVYAHGITDNITVKTSNLTAAVKGNELNTRSGSNFTIELHSTPVSLGTFTSDDNGDINISTAIPNTVDPGFHALHIYGKDVEGNDIDIYKDIYVAETEDDWDGDEILNEVDECIMIEPSGIDEDEDGIDDACDPIIGELIDLDEGEEEELVLGNNSPTLATGPRAARIDYKPEEYLFFII